MDQHIVRYQGGGHLAATKNIRCIDDVVVPYLFDLKLPPPNYSCAARPIRFAPPASDAREQQADQIEQFELWSERVPRVR